MAREEEGEINNKFVYRVQQAGLVSGLDNQHLLRRKGPVRSDEAESGSASSEPPHPTFCAAYGCS